MSVDPQVQAGLEAFQQKQFEVAISTLTDYCHTASDPTSSEYLQAYATLAKAYYYTGQFDTAQILCEHLAASDNPQASSWAKQALQSLASRQPTPTTSVPQILESDPQNSSQPEVNANPSGSPFSPTELTEQFTNGNRFFKQKQFDKAIAALETYLQHADTAAREYSQAQMTLVKAYQGNEQLEAAIDLCKQLLKSEKPTVNIWAKQYIQKLSPEVAYQLAVEEAGVETGDPEPPEASGSPEVAVNESSSSATRTTERVRSARSTSGQATPNTSSQILPRAGRAAQTGVRLTMGSIAANLAFASGVTVSLLFGMILVLSLSVLLIAGHQNPLQGFIISIVITLVFNLLVFFISPIIMDIIQGWLYSTQWVTLHDIERQSPESGQVIRRICQVHQLAEPKFGIIADQNPTAFTYGSLPGSARVVVSQGLFTYLDDDEIATVLAHEMGHIVHWDFAVMSVAATLVEIIYLLYVYAREAADGLGNSQSVKKLKDSLQTAAIAAYLFYYIGEYLLLYLSRTREYYADHFAAEVTGNPNGLSRALVKIAYGIMEEGQRTQEPSKLLQGTRALGIANPREALFTGTAYRIASEPQKVGRSFLWDFCNPWAGLMELGSTHPLTGKRVRALSTYAEQLGLDAEFDMARVIRESKTLNKRKLYGGFITDVLAYVGDWIGLALGLLIAFGLSSISSFNLQIFVGFGLIGFGTGTLLKTIFIYPDFHRAPSTDILSLMSDPYASPLHGRPVKLEGEVIGRGNPGYKFDSTMKMRDATGMILLRYSSRFGPLGNFLFGWSQADSFHRRQVSVVGWFRRGIAPYVDLIRLDCPEKWTVHSYHRFWSILLGLGAIALGFILPQLISRV